MSDYLAAKEGDKLVHSSLFADLISGVVKGAIYAAIGVVAAAAVGATGGAALAVGVVAGAAAGFAIGEAIDEFSDIVGKIGGVNFDGTIKTGSPNVMIKGKPAARAAGKIPVTTLIAENLSEAQPKQPQTNQLASTLAMAGQILANAYALIMATGQATAGENNKAAPQPAPPANNKPPSKGFWAGVADNVLAPTVASARQDATPENFDRITCDKWHYFSDGDDLYLAEGSKTVLINGQPACRNDDRSTCEAKISHKQENRLVKIGGKSVVVRDIKSGKNPFMSLLGEVIGGTLVGIARTGIRQAIKCIVCTFLGEAVGSAIGAVAGGVIGESIKRATSSAHPVHLTTGAKLLSGEEECDFILPGRLPLVWQRLYHSRNYRTGVLGLGWALPFEIRLRIETAKTDPTLDNIIYTDQSGRDVGLGHLELGQSVFYADEGFWLYRSQHNIFMIETTEGDYLIFEADPHHLNQLRLAKTQDRHQNSLNYVYNTRGLVTHIHDDIHNLCIRLSYQPQAPYRLQAVYQQSNDSPDKERLLVRYDYNSKQQLIEVWDADGYLLRQYGYDEHNGLMNQHRYATGLTAHYRWLQQAEPDPQSGETRWTVAEHWLADEHNPRQEYCRFDYDLAAGKLVMNQEGLGTSYRQWDTLCRITEFIEVDGSRWQFSWNNQSNLTHLIDPEGANTTLVMMTTVTWK